MPTYRYTARDERGAAVNGTLAAATPEALADQLKRRGYCITASKELRDGLGAASRWRVGGGARSARVREEDLAICYIELAKMVHAGIPLLSALHAIAQQTDHPALQRILHEVAGRVEGGDGFSESLARYPRVFSTLWISMVRAGELSGKLDEILRRLALLAKRQAELRQQLQTALLYPAVLIAVGIGVVVFLITGIIPKFMTIFLDAQVPLPWPTQLLYQLSQVVRHHGLWLAAGAAVTVIVLRRALRTPAGRRRADRLVIGLPVIGPLARASSLAGMSRTLETLFASGVPVLEALTIAEQTCHNAVIGEVCRNVQANVRKGGTLSEPLARSPEIPPMVAQMVAVGESSGTVDQMWGELAEHYEEMLQHGLKRMMAMVEPACLVIMGGMVAFIMASILLPMFRMVNVIR